MSKSFAIELNKPVAGEASIEIDQPREQVFEFVGEQFFDNYPKWAMEVIEFQPLDGHKMQIGAKARQVRKESGAENESIFAVTQLQPNHELVVEGLDAPYKQKYLFEDSDQQATRLTFRFELLEIDLFMRPFEKLIRYAIEDGAENTVENIKNLLLNRQDAQCA